jgi:hypothetical protein
MKPIVILEWVLYIVCIIAIWPLPLLQYFIALIAIIVYGAVMYAKGKAGV